MSNSATIIFDKSPPGVAFTGAKPDPRTVSWQRRASPPACASCAARSGDAQLCAAGVWALPAVRDAGPIAALPSPGSLARGACLRRAPPYAATLAAWLHSFPVDRLIQSLKYGGRRALAEPSAEALASAAARPCPALPRAIVPLPLSRSRPRERGFHQAQEIARRVAKMTGLPLKGGGLRRTLDGPARAALAWNARARDVRHAFAADASLTGATIAIVDDVMTTGATLAAAAVAARRAGALHVDARVVAQTPPP